MGRAKRGFMFDSYGDADVPEAVDKSFTDVLLLWG